jgi:hypothetical protein
MVTGDVYLFVGTFNITTIAIWTGSTNVTDQAAFTVIHNADVKLYCIIDATDVAPNCTWHHGNDLLGVTTYVLTLLKVTPSTDGGNYSFTASKNGFSQSRSIVLSVTEPGDHVVSCLRFVFRRNHSSSLSNTLASLSLTQTRSQSLFQSLFHSLIHGQAVVTPCLTFAQFLADAIPVN